MSSTLTTAPANVGPASQVQQANLPGGQQGSINSGGTSSALPFMSSTRRHREQMALANAVIPPVGTGFAASQIQEQSVPAYGFLRGLWIRVVAAGGTGAGAAAAADSPFNFLGAVSITDPDGAPIYSVNSGYTAFLVHKY